MLSAQNGQRSCKLYFILIILLFTPRPIFGKKRRTDSSPGFLSVRQLNTYIKHPPNICQFCKTLEAVH